MVKIRIDMHTHTRSSDGVGTPSEIAEAAIAAGLHGICLTDHNVTYAPENLEVAKECRRRGLMVFPGCEFSTNEGHLLVYGVNIEDLKLERYASMQIVLTAVWKAGGFAAPSHPFKGYSRVLGERLYAMRHMRAIEVANGQNAVREPEKDLKAVHAAAGSCKFTIGGSDAHFPENTGLCWTEFDGDIKTERDFIRELRTGQYRARVNKARVKALRDEVKSLDSQARGKYVQKNASVWNDLSLNKTSQDPDDGAYTSDFSIVPRDPRR